MQPVAKTAVQDLGRFDVLEVDGTQAVLWGRFGVVGELRANPRGVSVVVEDLDRKLGDGPGHRLDLHIINEVEAGYRARVQRGLGIRTRIAPVTLALAHTASQLIVVTEPGDGRVVERVDRPVAYELATLLAELHAVGLTGIDLRPEILQNEDGRHVLDNFSHIMHDARSAADDVAAFVSTLVSGGVIDQPAAGLDAAALVELLELPEARAEFEFSTDPPFVGRQDVLADLEDGLAQARFAQPTAVIVKGKRGIGKSRLLREFAARHLNSDNVLVLTGAWQSQSGDTRSGLLGALEQLSRVLPRFDPDERDEIRRRIQRATRHLGAIVARSAPALGAVLRHAEELPELELGGDFSRHTVVIADVLKSIGTRQRPLVLILDNVETIDANAAAILEIIVQSRPAHYTLVVMGMRTNAGSYVPGFEHEAITLQPLEQSHVDELLERSLQTPIDEAESIAQVLRSVSQGVPLSVGLTLRAWVERGRLVRGADGVWRARKSLREELSDEPNVRDLFSFRFASASESTRRAALEIGVFGTEVRSEYFTALGPAVDSAITELCERGILMRTPAGVRFPHDTIRELVLDSFDTDEQRQAHQQAASILADQGAPVPQIAYHRDLGFDANNEPHEAFDRLSRLHVEAGRDRLDVYDLERARWHLERALDHSHDQEQRGLAAEGLADICLLQEDIDTAVSLYTAIIATADPINAVRVAAKATQFLYGKNATDDARQLGNMALEMAAEPTPSTPPGKIWVLVSSLVRPLFGSCKLEVDLRDGLCRLYNYMLYSSLIDDPIGVPMFAVRGRWIAGGLETGAAAVMRSLEAALSTVLGFLRHADRVFAISNRIAQSSKDAWAQGMVFHHWGGALLAQDRYSDGQDRLDDAIAAFRETGDVSIALIAMNYKSVYGRDRERADRVLGWIDETLTTAQRHGKRSAVLTTRSLQLHVLARQGRTDLDERLAAVAEETTQAHGIERLLSNTALASAYLELNKLEQAAIHIRKAQADSDDMGGAVPEMCQEVHFVAALVMLARPNRTRAEQKELRASVRTFRKATRKAPRLAVLMDVLELKLALELGKTSKAHQVAKKIVGEFDNHENLWAARVGHKALARLIMGDNVLAAAEHEKLARNYGRRLGLADHVLLSDFSEIRQEVGIIALTEENSFSLEDTSTREALPAAGMLTSVVGSKPAVESGPPSSDDLFDFDDQSDVLEAWALTGSTSSVTLGQLCDPVRAAIGSALDSTQLEFVCPEPELEVPFLASDLELLLTNMILAARDALPGQFRARVDLGVRAFSDPHELSEHRITELGNYLVLTVLGTGGGSQAPVLGAFSRCENLAQVLGGVLSASTSPGRVTFNAYMLMNYTPAPSPTLRGQVLVIHPEESVRQTLAAGLDELGVTYQASPPGQTRTADLELVTVIFADGASLEDLRPLVPLSGFRLVEILRHGDRPTQAESGELIRLPFEITELEGYIA